MLEQLRGRNLAHVGCTLGLLGGLILGLVVAIIIIQIAQSAAAANWAAVAWLGLTFALGALGYYLGGRYSRRLWGTDSRND
jgi:hypothetical protein